MGPSDEPKALLALLLVALALYAVVWALERPAGGQEALNDVLVEGAARARP
jgi:DNA polymerase V